MTIYTIGYARKTAGAFFELLRSVYGKHLLDIRLRNTSQLASFTKKGNIEYFTRELTHLVYRELPVLAPSQAMLRRYRAGKDWIAFEEAYAGLMLERRVHQVIDRGLFTAGGVLLCGEPTPERCHRRLAAEILQRELFPDARIVHL